MPKGKSPSSTPPRTSRPRRPPPRHQLTLDEALARTGIHGVTSKAMFGGRCYYVNENPFSFVLGEALALRLPPQQLKDACSQDDGQVFHPGGGDFIMREYLELSDQALADEEKIDAYVIASTRFMGGQAAPEEGLVADDLLKGREELYRREKRKIKRKT